VILKTYIFILAYKMTS